MINNIHQKKTIPSLEPTKPTSKSKLVLFLESTKGQFLIFALMVVTFSIGLKKIVILEKPLMSEQIQRELIKREMGIDETSSMDNIERLNIINQKVTETLKQKHIEEVDKRKREVARFIVVAFFSILGTLTFIRYLRNRKAGDRIINKRFIISFGLILTALLLNLGK